MKRYLVTDPCYIIPDLNGEWDKFLEETDGYSVGNGYKIPGVGVIISSGDTAWGDGTWHVAPGMEVSADAGLVCIVELDDNYEPTPYNGNAITISKSEAEGWMREVQYGSDEEDGNLIVV